MTATLVPPRDDARRPGSDGNPEDHEGGVAHVEVDEASLVECHGVEEEEHEGKQEHDEQLLIVGKLFEQDVSPPKEKGRLAPCF